MKIINTLLLIMFGIASSQAQNYNIDWHVIGSGGGSSASSSYEINGTAGQPIVGGSSSASYSIEAGYWIGGSVSAPSEYPYLPGDANMIAGVWGTTGPKRQTSDITYLVNNFNDTESFPACLFYNPNFPNQGGYFWASADFNGNCAVQTSDITRLLMAFRTEIDQDTDPELVRFCGWNHADSMNYFIPLYRTLGEPGTPDPPDGWTTNPNQICEEPPELINVKLIPLSKTE